MEKQVNQSKELLTGGSNTGYIIHSVNNAQRPLQFSQSNPLQDQPHY